MPIELEIKCYATLARHLPPGGKLELPEGSSIGQVITTLGIDPEEVKIIFLNGVHASETSVLANGDRVGLFPPIGGG